MPNLVKLADSISTVTYKKSLQGDLVKFCKAAAKDNLINNASLEAMKLDWCIANGGAFHLTYYKTKLISVSGCHPLPQFGQGVMRVLFRGATLTKYQNLFGIVSRTHMNSFPFYSQLPMQLKFADKKGYTIPVVTTNYSNPNNMQSMSKSHRAFFSLEKTGIVTNVMENIELFHTEQAVWRINIEQYTFARKEFNKRHGLK
jgi:hypothetical protein